MAYVQDCIEALEESSHDCGPEKVKGIREISIGGRMIDVEVLCRPVPSDPLSVPIYPQRIVSLFLFFFFSFLSPRPFGEGLNRPSFTGIIFFVFFLYVRHP